MAKYKGKIYGSQKLATFAKRRERAFGNYSKGNIQINKAKLIVGAILWVAVVVAVGCFIVSLGNGI